MSTPSELDALKEQLDTLLEDRLVQIEPDGENSSEQQEEVSATRPTPRPESATAVTDVVTEVPFPQSNSWAFYRIW